ncbi:MAG: Maf family protein [Bacilli bacterium]|nr:Maf family protein [Bacilli bacterium]
MKIVLGSKSPRRKELLEQMGLEFIVDAIDVEEDVKDFLTPQEYVMKTAIKKGMETSKIHPADLVVCADTIVVHNNKILEKPKTKEEARQMIDELQGDFHHVYTAVYLEKNQEVKTFVEETKVFIDEMTSQEIEEYISTKEPYDKAGAYAIQGFFGKYIKSIEGDFYNVMGLPVNKVYREIKKLGNKS